MGQMGQVYIDLEMLGAFKVRQIEDSYLALKGQKQGDLFPVESIAEVYKLDKNTAIMICSGAKEHKYSKMLENRRD